MEENTAAMAEIEEPATQLEQESSSEQKAFAHEVPVPMQIGILLSVGWVALASGYGVASVGVERLAKLLPGEMVVFLVSAFLPLVVVWLVVMASMRRRDLAVVTEDLFSRLGMTEDKLAGRISGMETALAGLNAQARLLEDNVSLGIAQLEGARQRMAQEVSLLDGALQKAGQDLRQMVDTAARSGQALSVDMENAAERLSHVSRGFSGQSADTLTGMENRLGAMTEKLQAVARQADEAVAVSVSAAESKVRGLLQGLQEAGEQIVVQSDAAGALEGRLNKVAGHLDEESGKFVRQVDDAIARAGHAGRELGDRFGGVGAGVEKLAGKLESALERVEQKKEDILAAGERSVERADSLRKAMVGAVTEIGDVSGRFSREAKGLSRDIRNQGEALAQVVDSGLSRMGELTEKVGHAGAEIASVAHGLEDTLEGASRRLDAGHSSLVSLSGEVCGKLEGAVGSVEEGERRLSDALGRMRTEMDAAGEVLAARHAQVAETGEGMGLVLGGLAERLHLASSELVRMSQEAETRATGAAEVFSGRLAELQQGVATAGQLISSMADGLRQVSGDVARHAEETAGRLRGAGDALCVGQDNLRAGAEKSVGILDGAREAMSRQAQEVLEAAARATAHLEEVGETFRERMEDVGRAAPKVVENIQKASGMAREISSGLADAVTKSAAEMMAAAEHVREEMTSLSQEAGTTVSNLGFAESGIESAMGRLRGELAQAVVEIAEIENKVSGGSSAFAGLIREAGREAHLAAHEVKDQLDAVRMGTQGVIDMVAAARQGLVEEAERFVGQAGEKLVAARSAAAEFGVQAQALMHAAGNARLQAEEIRSADATQRRASFLRAARDVLEGLRGLAVDMVRVLDGQVPDDAWKAYLGGDTGTFIGLLAARQADAGAVASFRDKMAQDEAFRGMAMQYVRQFEEILSQASKLDQGDLLGSVFMSSDIGKIYMFLKQVASA